MAETSTTPATPAVEQAPQADVVARMGNFLDKWSDDQAKAATPEAPPPPEKPTAPQPELVAESPDGQAADDELTPEDLPGEPVEAQPDADAFEIVHDGQQHKLSRADTIKFAQKGFDYERKMESLNQQSRTVTAAQQKAHEMEQALMALAPDLAQVEAFKAQLAPYQNVDWVRLANEQPLDYPKYRAAYDVAAQNFQSAAHNLNVKAEQFKQAKEYLTAQMVQQEKPKVLELIPEWRDPVKREAGVNQVKTALRNWGAPESVIDAIHNCQPVPMGALAVAIINKAAKYDALVNAKTSKSKLLQTAPPVAKPGAAQTQSAQSEKQQRTMQRLRKTGTIQDAAAALAARLK